MGGKQHKTLFNLDPCILQRTHEAKTATTWGKIHHSKDGVHVVPHLTGGY